MDRRKALINIGLITGGILLLPACDFSKGKETVLLHKLQVTPEEDQLLDTIVGTIIPEGEIPGAESLNVADFVWTMAGDCLQKEQQELFLKGLRSFDNECKKNSGMHFQKLEPDKRAEILTHIEKSDMRELRIFLRITKRYTLQGYMNSEYIMTKIMPYSLVPGSYGTCETIDNQKRININA